MGVELYSKLPVFKKWMHHLDDLVKDFEGYSIIDRLYDPTYKRSDPFSQIEYTHLSIFMVQYSLAQCFIEASMEPDYLLGTSLGEYVAIAVSGAVALKDIIRLLLFQSGWLKDNIKSGGMLSIFDAYDKYSKSLILEEKVEIAAINSKRNFVVAGYDSCLAKVEKILDNKVRCYKLPIEYPFHSSALDFSKVEHIKKFNNLQLEVARTPIISCTGCGKVNKITSDYLWDIVRKPIMFMETINQLELSGGYIYIDLSPSGTFANFLNENLSRDSRSIVYSIFSPFHKNEYVNFNKLIHDLKMKKNIKRSNEDMKAIVFPGQGSQRIGMGGNLFDEFPEITQKSDEILGYSIKELCLNNSKNNLDQTEYTQPAIYIVNAMHYLKLLKEGNSYDFFAGHSLGEYNALHAGGVFDFVTGLRLVVVRSKLMAEAQNGKMGAIIGLTIEEINHLLKKADLDSIDIANYNSPSQIVAAGPEVDLRRFEKEIMNYGKGRYVPLRVSAAFHSRYMKDAKRQFAEFLKTFKFFEPKVPIIANYDAHPYKSSTMYETLSNQIDHSVKWEDSVKYLLDQGVSDFIEAGNNNILLKMITEIQQNYNTSYSPKKKEKEKVGVYKRINTKSLLAELYGEHFIKEYNINYPYICGGMYRGISSVDMVVRAAKAGMLGFFGTGGLKYEDVELAINNIKGQVTTGYGMSFMPNHSDEGYNKKMIDLFLDSGIHNIEASGFINIVPSIVKYRLKGLKDLGNGKIVSENKIIAKLSRPEIAIDFLKPAPSDIVKKLREDGEITEEEELLSQNIPLADDICVEADSGGHTDMGNAFVLLPTIIRLSEEIFRQYHYSKKVRIGLGGGIGTPEAVASAFLLGAKFIVIGSINQCTIEAGTSDLSKDLLNAINIQDTEYTPAGDMFELGAKVQVLKKGVFFPARANKLYEVYKFYDCIEDIDTKISQQIQRYYFGRSFNEVYQEIKEHYSRKNIKELYNIESSPKHKMAVIFKEYFRLSTKAALIGDATNKVNFQIMCGPSLGAFNQWAKNTELKDWRNRHIDEIGVRLIQEAEYIIKNRVSYKF